MQTEFECGNKITRNSEFIRTVWDAKKKKNVSYSVKGNELICYLRESCNLEKGLTFRELISFVRNNPALEKFISIYSWCSKINEFYSEMNEPIKEERKDTIINHLVIYWAVEYWGFSIEWYPGFGADGKIKSKESYGDNRWHKTSIGVSLSPLNEIMDLPIVLDKKVKIIDHKNFKNKKPILESVHCFSLLDILDAIYWDISFYGGPKEKKNLIKRLDREMKAIQDGTAKTIPAEEVFTKIRKKIKRK
jgi:hypothetical protein